MRRRNQLHHLGQSFTQNTKIFIIGSFTFNLVEEDNNVYGDSIFDRTAYEYISVNFQFLATDTSKAFGPRSVLNFVKFICTITLTNGFFVGSRMRFFVIIETSQNPKVSVAFDARDSNAFECTRRARNAYATRLVTNVTRHFYIPSCTL
jgi:hypothetical protein